MAKKKDEQNKLELEPKIGNSVIPVSIVTEMKDSYISYAMSVITGRALPDVRDGLKPVHRRILYAMHEMGLTASAKFRKSAAVVGDVLGKYHPHGDSSVYEAMVNMAQTFSFRYPLILGQGNFGSIDGDSQAAMRYTEAKMSKISGELLKDLDKETVAWRPNYDGTRKEPIVLPAGLPALLLNGTLGIAVGMATKIPPHNLGELVDACIHMVEHPTATTEDLMEFVKGPDFPLGGIVYGSKDMLHAYSTGRGGIVCRGEAEMIEMKNGSFNIEITSIPYQVNKSDFIMSIADLVQEKKIEGIKDIRDLSTKDIKIVIELKSSAFPQKILNYLYKHTQLEQNFNLNMVALNMGQPETMSLANMISYFVDHRFEVVRRRTEFDLKKAKDREHILLGLKKALDHIDKIITTIRESKDASVAKVNLIKVFKFSDLQADAILEMRLQKLAGLERKQVETELAEKQKLIGELESLLSSDKKIRSVISKELSEMKEKYADERRTKIIKSGVKQLSDEDLIPDKEAVLVYTAGGYVKRTDPGEYRAQRRGGVGVIDLETKEEDFVTQLVGASTHDDLLFFTNLGKTYQIKMYDIPEGKRATKGKSIMNFLSLGQEEKVTSILPMSKAMKDANVSMILVTANGIAKKVKIDSFKDVRRSGLIAITLEKGDSLVSAKFVEKGDDVSLVSSEGQSIRFKESDVREMGRQALGVTAMKLDKGDLIIGVGVIGKNDKDASILTISEHGLGKMTSVTEYKTQKRGGSGIATSKVTNKTGKIMNALIIKDETEIIAMSKKGQVIRTELKSIPVLGRSTQGVTIMKLREGDSIASIVCA